MNQEIINKVEKLGNSFRTRIYSIVANDLITDKILDISSDFYSTMGDVIDTASTQELIEFIKTEDGEENK